MDEYPDPRKGKVTLYPHGGEREWSTKMYDEWKRDLGVQVIPAAMPTLTPEEAKLLKRRASALVDAVRLVEGESGEWQPQGRRKRREWGEVVEAREALDRILLSLIANGEKP